MEIDDELRHESARDAVYELPMTLRNGPLPLIICLAVLIAAIVAGIWLMSLPSRMVAVLEEQARQIGLDVNVGARELMFSGGPGVRFSDVVLTSQDKGVSGQVGAITFSDVMPWSTPKLTVTQPNISVTVSPEDRSGSVGKTGLDAVAQSLSASVHIEDGALRVVGKDNAALLDVTSLSGEFSHSTSGAAFRGHAGINGVRAAIRAESDDIARLMSEGAPTDIFVTSLTDATPFDLQFSGRARLGQNFALDGRFSSAASDAQIFFALLGLPSGLPVGGALASEGGVSISSTAVTVNDLTLTQGETDAKGRLSVTLRADGSTVDGVLHLPRLVFPSREAGPWSEQPFIVPNLAKLKGAFEINAQELIFGALTASAPRLTIRFDPGAESAVLRAGKDKEQYEATLQSKNADIILTGRFATEDATALSRAITGTAMITGPATGTFEMSSAGKNPAEIIARANGQIDFTFKQASVQGIGPLTASVSAQASDGLIQINQKGLKADGKSYAIIGEIDLLRQALALDVTPQGGKRFGINGSWIAPATGVDVVGAPRAAGPQDQVTAGSN